MSGHTPGPWDWYWRQSDGETDCGVYSEKHQGHVYSVCRAPRYQTEDQWAADARLIAAAPDGLIAGTDLLEVVKAAIRVGDWKVDGACDPDAAIRRMEQFIAKATGEQP